MNKKVGISVFCAGVALSLVMGVSACKKDEQEYITQKIEKGDITQKITASGIINPISTINIGTQVSGTVAEIFVDYNTPVTEGQLLAQIDPALFEATVAHQSITRYCQSRSGSG